MTQEIYVSIAHLQCLSRGGLFGFMLLKYLPLLVGLVTFHLINIYMCRLTIFICSLRDTVPYMYCACVYACMHSHLVLL